MEAQSHTKGRFGWFKVVVVLLVLFTTVVFLLLPETPGEGEPDLKPASFHFGPIPPPKIPVPGLPGTNCPVPSPYQRPGACIADYPSNISVVNFFAEARKLPGISPAIISVLKNTPTSWPLILMLPPGEVTDWVLAQPWAKLQQQQKRELKVTPMNPSCIGKNQNCLCFDPEFWNLFQADYLFLFHADSALCTYKDYNLANFLHYDYLGAPWDHVPYQGVYISVGNGGFTLRNISLMKQCLQKVKDRKKEDEFFNKGYRRWPEDVWFGYCAFKYGRACPKHIAGHFSTEIGRHSEWPLGLHQTNRFGHNCRMPWNSTYLSNCPEASHMFPPCP